MSAYPFIASYFLACLIFPYLVVLVACSDFFPVIIELIVTKNLRLYEDFHHSCFKLNV